MQPSDDEDFICVGSKPTVGISDDLLGVPHRRKRKRPRIPADLDEGPLQVVAILGSSRFLHFGIRMVRRVNFFDVDIWGSES